MMSVLPRCLYLATASMGLSWFLIPSPSPLSPGQAGLATSRHRLEAKQREKNKQKTEKKKICFPLLHKPTIPRGYPQDDAVVGRRVQPVQGSRTIEYGARRRQQGVEESSQVAHCLFAFFPLHSWGGA
ncbi:hypothetical protein BGZ63DRAFT_28137 [Mariannaea sp. PMI_226]|nr:hypothetical protein BGZ63DRAFT_28137 [Mariannaea sp. PMI_226]